MLVCAYDHTRCVALFTFKQCRLSHVVDVRIGLLIVSSHVSLLCFAQLFSRIFVSFCLCFTQYICFIDCWFCLALSLYCYQFVFFHCFTLNYKVIQQHQQKKWKFIVLYSFYWSASYNIFIDRQPPKKNPADCLFEYIIWKPIWFADWMGFICFFHGTFIHCFCQNGKIRYYYYYPTNKKRNLHQNWTVFIISSSMLLKYILK